MQDVVTTALGEASEQSKRKDIEHAVAITQLKSADNTAQQQLAVITHALAAVTTRLGGRGRRQHYGNNSEDRSNNKSNKENIPSPK